MARPLCLEFPGAVYHITSLGNARHDIVADDLYRTSFLPLLLMWLICHAYCLMDNHYHLLVETLQVNLFHGWRQLIGRYTRMFNRRQERVGHRFQRFTAILVSKNVHLLGLCRCVVLNSVRVKMVTRPRVWPWSSYRATMGETTAPLWVTTDWILRQFGTGVGQAQERYRRIASEGRRGPRPWEQVRGQIYFGSGAFIAQHQPNGGDPRYSPSANAGAAAIITGTV